MNNKCIDLKARLFDTNSITDILQEEEYVLTRDEIQTDTYYKVPEGRLKFREGKTNELIYYERTNQNIREANITIIPNAQPELKSILEKNLGISCIVEKHRKQYEKENVYVRIDEVKDLGLFTEILCYDQGQSDDELREQLNNLKEQFNIQDKDLFSESYSDMIMQR